MDSKIFQTFGEAPYLHQNSSYCIINVKGQQPQIVRIISLMMNCIHRLFPCWVCPCSLVTRYTDNETLFCLVPYPCVVPTIKSKERFIGCAASHKGTRTHTLREQPMDTGLEQQPCVPSYKYRLIDLDRLCPLLCNNGHPGHIDLLNLYSS